MTGSAPLDFAGRQADYAGMARAILLRFAPIALLAVAPAVSAQVVSLQRGQPPNFMVPPGEVGQPGGRDGSIAQNSQMDSNWRRDMEARKEAEKRGDAAHPAKSADLVAGAEFADNKGVEVGYIKAIMSDGVVVATQAGQVKVPAEAFGKNSKGLLIGMSKADFDKLVAGAAKGS